MEDEESVLEALEELLREDSDSEWDNAPEIWYPVKEINAPEDGESFVLKFDSGKKFKVTVKEIVDGE